MIKDIERTLFSEKEIQNKVKEIGLKISNDYKDKNPIMICILRGACVFLSDLIRAVEEPVQIDFLSLSSYGNSTESSGVVKIRKDIDVDISGRHVIVVEDIIDTGLTLQYIKDYLSKHNPTSIKICAFLDKPKAHKIDLEVDFIGYEIENEFVVGYGLDYAEKYRNLPFIGVLKKEMYL